MSDILLDGGDVSDEHLILLLLGLKALGLNSHDVSLGLEFCGYLSQLSSQFGLLSGGDGLAGDRNLDLPLSSDENIEDFGGLGDPCLDLSDSAGDHGDLLSENSDLVGVGGEHFSGFLSLGKCLFVCLDEHVLEVGNLNLVLSLIGQSGDGIGNTVDSSNSLSLGGSAGLNVLDVGSRGLSLLCREGLKHLGLNADNLGVFVELSF